MSCPLWNNSRAEKTTDVARLTPVHRVKPGPHCCSSILDLAVTGVFPKQSDKFKGCSQSQ